MAYIKQFTNGAGFTGDYWRLTGLEINKFSNSVEAHISCYKDKGSRDTNLVPFAHKVFTLKLENIELSKDIQEEVYKLIKTAKSKTGVASINEKPFFEDAIEA